VSTFADLILDAAFNKFRGTDQQTNRGLALYPLDDDWQFIPFSDQRALNVGDLPIGFNIMQIDKLIDQVTASITAIAEERQLPDFSVKPINDYGDDFFMKKDSDADGREVLVGLTFEETAEYRDLSNRWMTDRIDRAEKKRHAELNTRHEAARLRRMGQTFDQRMAEAKGDA